MTAEVVQAQAQLRRSANRLKAAADGVADAAETAEKNLRGLVPGKRVGDQLTLVFRPQEAVAAVAALDQAYRDYYGAIARPQPGAVPAVPRARPPGPVPDRRADAPGTAAGAANARTDSRAGSTAPAGRGAVESRDPRPGQVASDVDGRTGLGSGRRAVTTRFFHALSGANYGPTASAAAPHRVRFTPRFPTVSVVSLNPISAALRRPVTVLVLVAGVAARRAAGRQPDEGGHLPAARTCRSSTSASPTAAWTRSRWRG